MRQIIESFLHGLSASISEEFQEKLHDNIVKGTEEAIEKYRDIFFVTGIAVFLMIIGFFLLSWGIASIIDTVLDRKGLGFLIMGLIVALIGMIVYIIEGKKIRR